jgi:hypothetical protein
LNAFFNFIFSVVQDSCPITYPYWKNFLFLFKNFNAAIISSIFIFSAIQDSYPIIYPCQKEFFYSFSYSPKNGKHFYY